VPLNWNRFKQAVDSAIENGAVLKESNESGAKLWVLTYDDFWIHACADKKCVTELAEFLGIHHAERPKK
jgi:hypothetical protein